MWAYKIHKAYELKDCYPISTCQGESKEVEISFNCMNPAEFIKGGDNNGL